MTINQLPEITESSFTYVVLMEDEILHTAANGYRCSDYTCPCADAEAASMEQDPEDSTPLRVSAHFQAMMDSLLRQQD